MPRIVQYAQRYAEEDFRKEIRIRQAEHDLSSKQALADAAGMPRQTLCKRLIEPGSMSVEEFRKIISAINPDPIVVLSLLGYSKKDLKNYLKNLGQGSA